MCVVHGAGPQISLEMERAGIPVEFVGGRRVTTAAGLEVVRAVVRRRQRRALRRDRRARGAALRRRDRARGRPGARARAWSARRARPPCRRSSDALDAGRIPVVAPIAVGPLNVNADSAAAAIAIGIGADRLLFLTDVDGLILGGEVVDRIDVADAEELMASGTLEGGIIPKLGAAVTAPAPPRRPRLHRPDGGPCAA